MTPASELTQFDGKEDARKLFFLLENVILKEESDSDKAFKLVMYLTGAVFDLYFDTFTFERRPTNEAKDYEKLKEAMIDQFSPKKQQAVIIKERLTYVSQEKISRRLSRKWTGHIVMQTSTQSPSWDCYSKLYEAMGRCCSS